MAPLTAPSDTASPTWRLAPGAYCALYTPFTADGTIDIAAFTRQCERLVAAGVGLVPCGTTGEAPTLTPGEWEQLVGIAVEVAGGRVPVVAGAGSNDTAAAIASARRAKALGADAALVVVPPYNKPPQRSLLAHFRAVVDGADVPVLLYNVPGRTGTNLAPETVLALAEDPRVVGIKEAGGQLGQVEAILADAPAGFVVLSGDDAFTLPLLALGGHGVVSVAANVDARRVSALIAAGRAGDFETARRLHFELRRLNAALFAVSNPIPVKHMAALLGHARADVRLPLTADAVEPALAERLAALAVQLELK
jgi:4-hydroxy-tetrahydrodipicolinate synthase